MKLKCHFESNILISLRILLSLCILMGFSPIQAHYCSDELIWNSKQRVYEKSIRSRILEQVNSTYPAQGELPIESQLINFIKEIPIKSRRSFKSSIEPLERLSNGRNNVAWVVNLQNRKKMILRYGDIPLPIEIIEVFTRMNNYEKSFFSLPQIFGSVKSRVKKKNYHYYQLYNYIENKIDFSYSDRISYQYLYQFLRLAEVLEKYNLSHGDLLTENILKTGKLIYLIDFGDSMFFGTKYNSSINMTSLPHKNKLVKGAERSDILYHGLQGFGLGQESLRTSELDLVNLKKDLSKRPELYHFAKSFIEETDKPVSHWLNEFKKLPFVDSNSSLITEIDTLRNRDLVNKVDYRPQLINYLDGPSLYQMWR